MPDGEEYPIAYTALVPGTPVRTSDGQVFATVRSVLVDEKVAVFDGVVIETAQGTRFVDADQIGTIFNTHVRTTLSAEQAAGLPEPDGSNLIDVKPSKSVADRLGGLFGRRGRR